MAQVAAFAGIFGLVFVLLLGAFKAARDTWWSEADPTDSEPL